MPHTSEVLSIHDHPAECRMYGLLRDHIVPICWGIALLVSCAPAPAIADEEGTFVDDPLRPFLSTYCLKCHSGDEPQGEFSLEDPKLLAEGPTHREQWETVIEYLRAEMMPPEDENQPKPARIKEIVAFINEHFLGIDCEHISSTGPATIRRLNIAEYANTIRDLLDIDYQGAADFPSDDVGYGFDNMGEVLSLSPILMERYLAAAEEIAQQAIVADDPRRSHIVRFEAEDLPYDVAAGAVLDSLRYFYSEGEVYTEIEIGHAGKYHLRGRAFGEQAGTEPANMAFRIDGKQIHVAKVTATSAKPEIYETVVELPAGKVRLAAAFVNDYYQADAPEEEGRDRNLAIDYIELEGPLNVEPMPLPESHRRIMICEPTPETRNQCIREIIRNFAERAYRRPLSGIEVSRLANLASFAEQEGASFDRGVQLMVQAVLASPHFLFRTELPDKKLIDGRLTNDYQLATRLSYFLWSSMPDETLFELAEEDALHHDGVLEAQVLRMLADPKSVALVDNFASQWLQLRNLDLVDPDRDRFPAFDDELRSAMRRETELFFETLIREDRSLLELIDADFTFLNQRLAQHYGIEGVQGHHFRRVQLDDPVRGGVLTQASVLTVTSNPTRTSPVKRGKWVMEQLLAISPPAPPGNVPQLEDEGRKLVGTLRQKMEQHRSDPACAICHTLMDPLGFGLENFDAVGAWRTQDEGLPIDASGELPDGATFAGPAELKQVLLRRSDDIRRCISEKLLVYALGRGLRPADQCVVDEIVEIVRAGDDRFSQLVIAIVRSDAFAPRQAEGVEQ